MSSINTSYAFLAGYSSTLNCLQSIEQQELNGGFSANPALLVRLRTFENDVLKKLYNTSIGVLKTITGYSDGTIPGDFEDGDYSSIDFSTGSPGNPGVLGDFVRTDFLTADFWTGNLGSISTGYSARLAYILEMFGVFGNHMSEISEADKYALDFALIQFLDSFDGLKDYLDQQGMNPCEDAPYQNNSQSLYLQAVGSDGSNGIPQGTLLRWSLAGDLADKHLPQGDYVTPGAATSGYNQPGDYISLQRTPYASPVKHMLDFESAVPFINHQAKRWSYVTTVTLNDQTFTSRASLTFPDATAYDQLAATLNPQTNAFEFLKRYEGTLELAVSGKTSFSVEFDFRNKQAGNSSVFKLDVLSTSAQGETLNIRQTVATDPDAPLVKTVLGDNISRIKLLKSSGGYLQSFSFETYDDFLGSRAAADWTSLGENFGLTLSNEQAFERLEASSYPIDNRWPQYNEGTRVRVANYQDKWGVSRPNDPSIKDTVAQYLGLSETDPRAMGTIKDETAGQDAPEMSVSYLDVLNLMATDFHVARMLGLGHIDVQPAAAAIERFIYKISYAARKAPDLTDTAVHHYMSLPTAKADSRRPEKPAIRLLSYGLPVNNGSSKSLFDTDGYTPIADVRLVNIGREASSYEQANEENFEDLSLVENFNNYENTKAIFYGIEYRPDSQSAFVKPEITNDKSSAHPYYAYDDNYPDGVPESVPVPDNADSLYIHFEQQEGVHQYAIYGLDWFSRASLTSDQAITNPTVFPVKNTLLPPADIAVQYVQKEAPLLFTTQTEQDWLSGRDAAFPGQDTGFSRVNFNWLDITDISHLSDMDALGSKIIKADQVKAYFKPGELQEITGSIKNILPVAGAAHLLMLQTSGYQLLDGSMITPAISADEYPKFTGSQLTTTAGTFKVTAIAAGTEGPVITIEKNTETDRVESSDEPGSYATTEKYNSPEAGSRFSLVENLADPANWSPVAGAVSLIDFGNASLSEVETSTDDEGNETKYLVGGISGSASIVPLDADGDGQPDMPGYYKVSFEPGISLAAHPQYNPPFDPASPGSNPPFALNGPHVEWYKGLIRIPVENSDEKKLMEVMRIVQSSPLVLYAYDADYQNEQVQMSSTGTDLVSGVNFHPGYKAYFYAEPLPDHTFNAASLLPSGTENSKKTLIGLQSCQNAGAGTGFSSRLSLPAILLSRRIEEPVEPEAPTAYGLKVRPDATGKAAFTMDIKIAPAADGSVRNPFGLSFYRTNQEDVLYALYKPETVVAILNDLEELTTDLYYNQRFLELANLTFDPDQPGGFKVYDAQPSPYGFPLPDKEGLTFSSDTLALKIEKLESAIRSTLLPLTEQTPVLSFIKTGLQTENKVPRIRNLDGQLLDPSQPGFDPFPMIRKFTKDGEANATYVRFTDYTLNAASRNLYFYACAETTNQLIVGPVSGFTGPVSILHTLPVETPVFRKYSIGTAAAQDSPLSITFQVSPFSPADNVSKISIYRSLSEAKAVSLQAMMVPFEIDLTGQDLSLGIEVTDSFADLEKIPFGETVYYRLAAVRTIVNEFEQPENVLSAGSAPVAIRLIDPVNPEAPELSYEAANNTLSWIPTAYNGTYYLYKQNQRGNWEKLSTVVPVNTVLPAAYILPSPLIQQDEDGNRVYNRFKVKVENSSGLLNLVDKELTI